MHNRDGEVFQLNQQVLKDAREVAHFVLESGADPSGIYQVRVGAQLLYLSANRANIVGPDRVVVDGVTFFLGFCAPS